MAGSSEAAGDAPPGWESATARAAFAFVALHVVDDSFVQPRPGTDASDEDLNPEYFAAAGEPKELWRIPDGGHTGGIDARSGEYERRVVGFFDRALLGAGGTAP